MPDDLIHGDNLVEAALPYDKAKLDKAEAAVREWSDAAGEWLRTLGDDGIGDAETAGHVKDMVDGARTLGSRIEATRKAEKQPHLDAGRLVDEAFNTLAATMTNIVAKLGKLQTAWIEKEEKRVRAERAELARIAQEQADEAERLRKQAEARNDTFGAVRAEEAAAEAAKAAEAAAKPVHVTVQSASGSGTRSSSLRQRRVCKIVNAMAAFQHVRESPTVLEAIEKALNGMVNAKGWPDGKTLAGVKIDTVRTAV